MNNDLFAPPLHSRKSMFRLRQNLQNDRPSPLSVEFSFLITDLIRMHVLYNNTSISVRCRVVNGDRRN